MKEITNLLDRITGRATLKRKIQQRESQLIAAASKYNDLRQQNQQLYQQLTECKLELSIIKNTNKVAIN